MPRQITPNDRDADNRALLRRLSHQGYLGTEIHVHRSLGTFQFRGALLVTLLLLPLAATAVMVLCYEGVLIAWEQVLSFGLDRLGIAAAVERVQVPVLSGALTVLTAKVYSWYPDATILWMTAALVLATVLATRYLPDRALPIAYVLRAGSVVQAIALLVFCLWPRSFPYDAPQHLRDVFALSVVFIGLVPWVHGLTYYIFDFGILRKIALTTVTVLFLVCFAPVKILVHAYILDRFSLLFMPILFLLFGAALDVFVLIALYAWGMSWRAGTERRAQRPVPREGGHRAATDPGSRQEKTSGNPTPP